MTRANRIWVVYRKELVDALRDRRTLIAMVVIPVVLYPLLMMVVLQALQLERAKLERQRYRIAVPDAAHRAWLKAVLREESTAADDEPASQPAKGRSLRAQIDATQYDIDIVPKDPLVCLNELNYQVVLSLDPPPTRYDADTPNRKVLMSFDAAEVPSNVAQSGLSQIIERHAQRLIKQRLENRGLDAELLRPLPVTARSVATPQKLGGSLLGQIMPFLLVIITITGAIYPAIDLTAGERERGTLETLLSSPVPMMQIVAGKFLVILTITITVTLLNLVSIGATVQFGGLAKAIAQALPGSGGVTSLPLRALPVVLLAMLPFAVLFSGIMLATCSFARTFKEAQNYMMPVMIGAMLPAMIVSYMPTLRLTGTLAVLPVANIVALIRELFLGKYDPGSIGLVMGSTCLYAAAAVAVAAKLYGQESIMFTDVGSYKTLLHRRFIRPAMHPSASTALLLIAIVFPVQFYFQSAFVKTDPGTSQAAMGASLRWTILGCQILCYAAPVIALTWYLRLNAVATLSLRMPTGPAIAGTLLMTIGIVPVMTALGRLQHHWFPPSGDALKLAEMEQQLFGAGGLGLIVLIVGVLPGICEELLFRGFLLSGLRTRLRPAALCVWVGVLFGLYHIQLSKIPLVTVMGVLLAFVCWRTGSIFAAMLIHAVNNGLMIAGTQVEALGTLLGQRAVDGPAAPAWVLPAAIVSVIAGLAAVALSRPPMERSPRRPGAL